MLPSSLVTQPQQQSKHLAHSRKQKNTKPFTEKVGHRQDVNKTSDICPSKSDGETLWNLAIAVTFFPPLSQIYLSEKNNDVSFG